MSKTPEALIGDYIPLEDHIDDDVVLTRSNGVFSMFSIDGVYPDTAAEHADRWFDTLHGAWLNIAAEDIEITVYQCRGAADPSLYKVNTFSTPFAEEFTTAYIKNLFANSLYSNRLFMAVEVHAPGVAAQRITQFFADTTTDPRIGITQRMNRLKNICTQLQMQLSDFKLTKLSMVERDNGLYSEIAEALVFAMTGRYRQIPMTTGRMGHAMFSETIRFNNKRIEFHGPGDTVYGEMYTLKEYPARTWPGMFSRLNVAPYYSTIVQSFRFISNIEGVKKVGRKQTKLVISKDKSETQVVELTTAATELTNQEWVLGSHSVVVLAFANTPEKMTVVGNTTHRDLAACGVVAARLTHTLHASWLSMMPEGAAYQPRPGFVKSKNFTAFAPLYGWPAGSKTGHWGTPIATFRTVAGTPLDVHWQPDGDDLGNTLITGTSGAGKTFLTASLLTFSSSRARIIALDHKQGWRFLFQEIKGDYAVLGSGRASMSPLKALDNAPSNLEFLEALFTACIAGTMTEEETRRLNLGLQTIMSVPPEYRNVGELRGFFDNEPEGAGVRLEKWIHGNNLGWVIDASKDTIHFNQMTGLDLTALLNNDRARPIIMMYLMHRIAECLDGTPCLIPIDEGWRALSDPTFRKLIETQLRTIRSKNGAVVFITQAPGDITESSIRQVLRGMCPTYFALPDPDGRKEDYTKDMGLTEGQWEALAPLQKGQGWFLLMQNGRGIVAQLPLQGPGMEKFIRIMSARESELRLIENKERAA